MSYIGENTSQRLSLIKGIDLKSIGQTTLYTVPSGKNCIITEILLEVKTTAGFTVAAIIRVGKAALYTEWLPATTLTGLDAVGEFIALSNAANLMVQNMFAAGDVVKIDVTTAAVATTLTVDAHIFGHTY